MGVGTARKLTDEASFPCTGQTGGGSAVESDRTNEKRRQVLSSIPFNTPAPDGSRSPASIGKAVKISGQIHSKEDLYVDGEVEGTIELPDHRLTIGPSGKVHSNGKVASNVRAREVVILGNVQGNVHASDKLEVRRDASVVGDIKTGRIVIEDGAHLKGSIDIVKHEPAKHPISLQPKPEIAPVEAAAPVN